MDHIKNAIEKSVRYENPWEFHTIENAFPAGFYQELLDSPMNWAPAQVGHRTVWLLNGAKKHPWSTARDILSSQNIVSAFNLATRTKGGHAIPRVNVDAVGYRLRVHPDISSKVGTISINLCSDAAPDWGLVINGQPQAIFLPFEPNSGYFFRRTAQSMHSVRRVAIGGRTSLMVPIFRAKTPRWRV